MHFGQDPVSMNVLKANILIDSCEEEGWTLLLPPQRIALPHTCPLRSLALKMPKEKQKICSLCAELYYTWAVFDVCISVGSKNISCVGRMCEGRQQCRSRSESISCK